MLADMEKNDINEQITILRQILGVGPEITNSEVLTRAIVRINRQAQCIAAHNNATREPSQ